MKLLIQRVSQASVCIDDTCFGRINSGLLIFIGIGVNDTKADIKYLARKVSKLRVFEDSDKKINYSLNPFLILKFEISFFDLVVTGFCPEITVISFSALSSFFGLSFASPMPIFIVM